MKNLIPKSYPKTILFSSDFEKAIIDSDAYGENFRAELSDGPDYTWIGPDKKLSSGKILKISGKIENGGKYRLKLYDNLFLNVSKNTRLTYHVFPSMLGDRYDCNYTQTYFGIELEFSDGSFLSDTGAKDTNGTGVSASDQGNSRILYTHQWNRINVELGKYAFGKTIKSVIITYDNPIGNGCFATYFDKIEIYDRKKTEFSRLCHRVNILHGTNDSPAFSRGLTAPAVLVPQGFNMYGPCTNNGKNKHYDYLTDRFDSITVSHEPSIWIDDRGTWQFMVNTSKKAENGDDFSTAAQINRFSHENEIALAHYYSVSFDENGGDAENSRIEITPTLHGVIARFTFKEECENRSILFDCQRADGDVEFHDDGSFTALSQHKNNGSHDMYIYGRFSSLPVCTEKQGKKGIASFSQDLIEMRFATSYISYEQAKHSYELELSDRSFEEICSEAADEWDEILSRVSNIKGATDEQLETVYTGLYYLYKYPNTLSENTGTAERPILKYRSPYSGKIEDGEMYINNGFWDTYRTVWAGYSLLTPEKLPLLLNGFVQHYKDQGLIPRWSAPGGVNCMVGTSSDVIFADAVVKGFDFDIQNAYDSALKNASVYSPAPEKGGRKNLNKSIFLGYTPGDREDFSWSVESYINDYGIAQMAKILCEREIDPLKKNKFEAEYRYFMNRAKNYAILFYNGSEKVKDKWFRGKYENGEWTTANNYNGKFDPLFWGNDFTETDAYNMAVSIPYDGQGLANLYGGKDKLAEKLDSIFETFDVYRGYGAKNELEGIHEQREMREVKLGRYGHSNQPSHHIIYMYDFTDKPWKAQKYSRYVTSKLYCGGDFGQGLPGDEDNGEMSTWFLFSALGFYPLSISSGEYAVGSPLFDEATLNFGGKKLVIKSVNNSSENIYVKSLTVNGRKADRLFITHDEIKDGGEIVFEMSDHPTDFGKTAPKSLTEDESAPFPLRDIAAPETIKNVSDFDFDNVEVNTVFTDVANVQILFNDISESSAVITAGSSVIFAYPEIKNVEIFTLTSSDAPEKSGIATFYASDGKEWKKLAETGKNGFKWKRYTRPFLTGDIGKHKFFKIVFEEDCEYSQIELIGK